MNIESREFWETVLKEYNSFKSERFIEICSRSITFNDKFNNGCRVKIRRLAKTFLIENKITDFRVAVIYLFVSFKNDDEICFAEQINKLTKIRIDFINWCIKRFSNDTAI